MYSDGSIPANVRAKCNTRLLSKYSILGLFRPWLWALLFLMHFQPWGKIMWKSVSIFCKQCLHVCKSWISCHSTEFSLTKQTLCSKCRSYQSFVMVLSYVSIFSVYNVCILILLLYKTPLCSTQRCVPRHQPPSSCRGPAKMLPASNDKSSIMDSSQASTCNIHQAAVVGRVFQWDTLLSERWIPSVSEDHKDHIPLPHPLWAKAVHLISDR